jgi:uncharacterized protein YecT (DUF1311 family)
LTDGFVGAEMAATIPLAGYGKLIGQTRFSVGILLLAMAGSAPAIRAEASPTSRAAELKAYTAEMGEADAQDKMVESHLSKEFFDCQIRGGASTREIRECNYAEQNRLDAIMNRAYRQKTSTLRVSRRKQLRLSQRAWLKRRRHFCLDIWPEPDNGTKELLAMDTCYLTSTITRTQFIERFK